MPAPDDAFLRAIFLGPHAENAGLFERLIIDALRDHVRWRRDHHPEDPAVVDERQRNDPAFRATAERLTSELSGLLEELKRGVPFFSGRYKGHMNYEQTLASQAAYFAAMLYNPNNVAIEASPVTTRLELDVARQIAEMIGYRPATSWGHLTSGGTVANFEALWIARNIHYLPVAASGADDELGLRLDVRTPTGDTAPLTELSLRDLLNIRPTDALDLWDALWASGDRAEIHAALQDHSLQAVGYQDYGRRLAAAYGDPLPPAVVVVAASAHYSWEKIVRALGIGSNQLRFIPIDDHYRMDPDALWRMVRDLDAERTPILACISVCGTTEESAVDRLDRVVEVRERAESELGVAFHLHSDAAYGGYAAAVTWDGDGRRRSLEAIRASAGTPDWPEAGWVSSMEALAEADSVTIDPHKLGYIPYPAGAIAVRDRRARELVAIDPPYLLPTRGLDSAEDLFLGRFILEGSKPGAAAAAVWLSHRVLPLDERGHGRLVERTAAGARKLHAALASSPLTPFRMVLLPPPDINIVCGVLTHPDLHSLAEVNALNEGIYARMSLTRPGAAPDYIITRTRFQTPMYDGAVDPLLHELGIPTDEWRESGQDGLVVLRATVMDPFLVDDDGFDAAAVDAATDTRHPDADATARGGHIRGFIAALKAAAGACMTGP